MAGLQNACNKWWIIAQEPSELAIEFAELASYVKNGVLKRVFSYAFAAGYNERKKEGGE